MLSGRVLFASGRTNDVDIWCLELQSGRLNQLTSGEDLNTSPRWSPDGTSIVYLSTGADLIPSIWLMDGDGGGKRRLTEGVFCQSPSWSPDGRSILFVSNAAQRTDLDVCSVSIETGEIVPLIQKPGIESDPCWSNDGSAILFSRREGESGDQDVIEYRLATKSYQRLTNHPASDFSPRYSPDGKQIAFISRRNGLSREEYERRRSAIIRSIEAGGAGAIPDGVIALKKLEGDGDIYVMTRDGSQIRALTQDGHGEDQIAWSPCGRYLVSTLSPKGTLRARQLRILEVASGNEIPVEYDRAPLEEEIGAHKPFNAGFWQRFVPNFIERHFVSPSFFGEESSPDWGR